MSNRGTPTRPKPDHRHYPFDAELRRNNTLEDASLVQEPAHGAPAFFVRVSTSRGEYSYTPNSVSVYALFDTS